MVVEVVEMMVEVVVVVVRMMVVEVEEVLVRVVQRTALCILCPKIICLSEKDLFCQIFSEFYICSDFCDPSINLFSSALTDRTTNRLGWGKFSPKRVFRKVTRFGGTNRQIETQNLIQFT